MTKQQQKDKAHKAYQAIADPEYEDYLAIITLADKDDYAKLNLARQVLDKIVEPAWEALQAKLKKINEQVD